VFIFKNTIYYKYFFTSEMSMVRLKRAGQLPIHCILGTSVITKNRY
jgi:hypothetical protein